MAFDPVFEIEAQALASILDELDYFQILKIPTDASPADVKAAYYRESRQYHPDRFFSAPDSDTKQAVARIYRRINEAYLCLRDAGLRAKYLADISGPDRASRLRFTEEAEQEQRQAKEAELGATPQGRKLFAQGLLDLEAGRHSQAANQFKMALMYEPSNATFQAKYEEAARAAGLRP